MKQAYIFVYGDQMGTRDEVKQFLNDTADITHWRYDLPNAFYLVSELSAQQLYERIQEFNDKKARFIVSEVGQNKEGWLTRKSWTLLNQKEYDSS